VVLCSTSTARLLDVPAARLGEDNTPEAEEVEEVQEKKA
jgi:hypothetical protein